MADWSWDIAVPSSLERLLLVCLEDHSCDERWVAFKFADLQRLTGMSQNRIKQAANTLWSLGRLEYRPSRGGHPQQFHTREGVVVTGTGNPPFPNVPFTYARTGDTPNTYTPSPGKPRPNRDEANEIVKHWYATTTPRPTPAGGYPAAVKIVETILAAGWTSDLVESALGQVPTISLATMEYQLRRPSQQQGGRGQSAPPMPQPKPAFCPKCGSSGVIRTQAGRRCVSCDEPLDV